MDGNSLLIYPKHVFNPEDLLNFVELDGFYDDWQNLGLNEEADRFALEATIMLSPRAAPVI